MESEKFTIAEAQEYYKKTIEITKRIDELISDLETKANTLNDEEKHKGIDNIINKIKEERGNFYNLIEFLPNYDKALYAKMYEERLEKVDALKNKFFPKKKFAFSKKIGQKPKQDIKKEEKAVETKAQAQQEDKDDLVIKNIMKEIIVKKDENKNNVIIENISDSSIYLLFNYKACYLKTLKNCKIYVGSVSGGSHITDCDNCEIYLITHQLRIHQTINSKFFVMINSNPIIEKSEKNIFYPLKIEYKGYEDNILKAKIDPNNNKWDQIQDFQWLKKEKSPNFEVKSDNEVVHIDESINLNKNN